VFLRGASRSSPATLEISMTVLPRKNADLLQWTTDHLEAWTTPAAIGLTAGQLTALTAVYDQAVKDVSAASLAREASKGATTTQNASIADLREQLSAMIRSIKTFADASSNPPAIYGLAQIPLPAPPQSLPAPGVASEILVTLNPGGSITLSWTGEFSAASDGAVYTVARKLPGASTYTLVGVSPGTTSQTRRMSYTDPTVPTSAAAQGVSYIITGQRGQQIGVSSTAITVQFGIGGAGATVTGAGLSIAA
jgi:hypothetical protein